MNATITKLSTTRKPAKVPAPKGASKTARKTAQAKGWSAAGIGLVAATLTGLSLKHLAHGVEITTGDGVVESVAMAIGIDLGMIGSELAMLTNPGNKAIMKWTNPFVWGSLLMSAGMNSFAFAEHSTSAPGVALSILMGFAIPAGIFCLMRVGAAQYLGAKA